MKDEWNMNEGWMKDEKRINKGWMNFSCFHGGKLEPMKNKWI